MKLFLTSFMLVSILSGVSGYIALYTPKFSRPTNTYSYPTEYLKAFEEIETHITSNHYDDALTLCNDAIVSSNDKKVVAKSYYLRSKIHQKMNDLENAKKDLLYAKEIDFETFSSRATYSFVKSLREYTLYETEIFSNRKKHYQEDLMPSAYYLSALIIFCACIFVFKLILHLKKESTKELL